jgi:RNA polymerase sigma-70 factor, ECF subfamily
LVSEVSERAKLERRAKMSAGMSAEMTDGPSEGRLIEACRQGDREAFRQLFDAYHRRVWSIALHFTGDDSSARDITQQVFLKLFTSIGQFRHESSFTTWLHRLVVNACLDEHRRRRRFVSLELFRHQQNNDDIRDLGEFKKMNHREVREGEDDLIRLEIDAAVRAAVRQLKPKLRIAILLKYFEGLSYQEMARVLGCSTGTVASRLNRGHKELARRLAHLRST